MSGYLWNLNASQQAALGQFRKAVCDVRRASDTDAYLLRWLRARDFDVTKAKKMYRDHLKWRKENGADDILHTYKIPEILRENFPGYILNPCKDGRPMWIMPCGVNVSAMLEALTPDGYQAPWHLPTGCFKTAAALVRMVEDNYPECLEKVIVINAPSFYSILWKYARMILSDRTADKFEVYGKDDWKKRLLEIADADSLPACWGGNMVGPNGDPRCRHKVNYGGALIIWLFKVNAGDVALGLRTLSGRSLVPVQRLKVCSHTPQERSRQCDTPGKYILEFDNTYGKTLAYVVNVVAPEEVS
ncbi:hypothetical protein MRX96_011581 [Rhipicephalus microplus]